MNKLAYASFLVLASSMVFDNTGPWQEALGPALLYFAIAAATFWKLSKNRTILAAWLWAVSWPLSMWLGLLMMLGSRGSGSMTAKSNGQKKVCMNCGHKFNWWRENEVHGGFLSPETPCEKLGKRCVPIEV